MEVGKGRWIKWGKLPSKSIHNLVHEFDAYHALSFLPRMSTNDEVKFRVVEDDTILDT